MELEDHLADRESKIAEAQAERQNLIDSDRPNWRNSLADLLEWQERHGVTAEELTEEEEAKLMLARWLTNTGANKLLSCKRILSSNKGSAYFEIGYFDESGFYCQSGETHNVYFNTEGITGIRVELTADQFSPYYSHNPIALEALKSFFSND